MTFGPVKDGRRSLDCLFAELTKNPNPGSMFIRMSQMKAVAEGKAKSELNEDYIKNLEKGLLYWNKSED